MILYINVILWMKSLLCPVSFHNYDFIRGVTHFYEHEYGEEVYPYKRREI